MPDYTTPGVYISELSSFPPSIVPVKTAIPVFIGYTEKARQKKDGDLRNVPTRISSLLEYEQFFGEADPEKGITVEVHTQQQTVKIVPAITNPSNYVMYYALQAYFANGGGPSYIVSVGDYAGGGVIEQQALLDGLAAAGKVDEITLNVFPDGPNMTPITDYYVVVEQALNQCHTLKDRFTICDVCMPHNATTDDAADFRNNLSGGPDVLKYGAAYYPYLEMQLDYHYEDKDVQVNMDGTTLTLAVLKVKDPALYNKLFIHLHDLPMVLPPSSALAGIYAQVDAARGVWKAPANVNVKGAVKPVVKITDGQQEVLNVDVQEGKSINAIRSFTGRGAALVWGARTLAGNDNEWRYIPVRRFFTMVEASVKKGTQFVVFEPNDSGTWAKVRGMIENFLNQQWQAGALAGSAPNQAFFVRVGLNETMTAIDIQEGRVIIEIGMAVVRPAEFTIIRITHKMAGD